MSAPPPDATLSMRYTVTWGEILMGICSYYLGPMDIPEADWSEYVRRALAMLRACRIVVGGPLPHAATWDGESADRV